MQKIDKNCWLSIEWQAFPCQVYPAVLLPFPACKHLSLPSMVRSSILFYVLDTLLKYDEHSKVQEEKRDLYQARTVNRGSLAIHCWMDGQMGEKTEGKMRIAYLYTFILGRREVFHPFNISCIWKTKSLYSKIHDYKDVSNFFSFSVEQGNNLGGLGTQFMVQNLLRFKKSWAWKNILLDPKFFD